MRSIKTKLLLGFSLIIFVILLILSIISVELFSFNQKNEIFEQIDESKYETLAFIKTNPDKDIKQLDRYIDFKKQFVIVVKDEMVLFSNETSYKTDRILEEAYEEYKEDYYHRDDEEHYRMDDRRDEHRRGRDDFVILYDLIEKNDIPYEVFIGVYEEDFDDNMGNIIWGIVLLNLTIFIILLVLGYFLINRTIKPLKLILKELNSLQSANDLTKRLKEIETKDEFEELIVSFNKMLENIESSVENIKQFSSDASHELKTPLTIIQGEIELCKDSNKSKEELEQSLIKIDIEQKKLQDIIKNFLLLSRLDKEVLKNKKASLDKAIFETVEQNLENLEKKNLELKLDIDEELEINFDEKYLNIVLNNLLSNAIKYTNEGFIEINAKKDNSNIVFEIKDSGIGINKKDQEKIFERFFRVDKVRTTSKDGIGLGLSIVKKICERFGSNIKVKSELEKGTSFIIFFDV